MPNRRSQPHTGVFTRIGRSRLHGVGVLAIVDIPAGTVLFAGEDERVVWRRRRDVARLPAAHRALYEDFGMVDGAWIGVPRSLNRLSVGWYVNHSAKPNAVAGDDGRFRSLRHIRRGEEITADYRTFAAEPLPFRPRRQSPIPAIRPAPTRRPATSAPSARKPHGTVTAR